MQFLATTKRSKKKEKKKKDIKYRLEPQIRRV